MGCGPSTAKGRENYYLIVPEDPPHPGEQQHQRRPSRVVVQNQKSSSSNIRLTNAKTGATHKTVSTAAEVTVNSSSPTSAPAIAQIPRERASSPNAPKKISTKTPTGTTSISKPLSAIEQSTSRPAAINPKEPPPQDLPPQSPVIRTATPIPEKNKSASRIESPPAQANIAAAAAAQVTPNSTSLKPAAAADSPKKKKRRKSSSVDKQSPSKTQTNTMNSSITTVGLIEAPQPGSASGKRFEEVYKLKGVLGTGAFSTVREGHHRYSQKDVTFAVKCVNRRKLAEEDEAALLDEVAILKEMRHVHIIRLYDFFTETDAYYLVLERMSGGELFDRIVAKAYYNEKEARDVCKIVLEAVGYCHANHIAHRDLKPENLLLLSDQDDSAVKIADFGFAKKVLEPNSLKTQCGTPGYVAPEILEGVPYDERADMWSVGVILYILLGGYPPFIENNQRELFRKIRKGQYEFHPEYWDTVSAEAKNLISSLLTVKPSRRLTAEQALDNMWIGGSDSDLAKKDLGVQLEEFKKFNAKRKFKAAVSTVMAVNKLQSLGKDFQKNLS